MILGFPPPPTRTASAPSSSWQASARAAAPKWQVRSSGPSTSVAECSPEEQDRLVVLITDGQVGNEDQLLSTLGGKLNGIRVFTLGIDRAVNEGFLRRAGRRGGGACELVESEARLDEVMQSIHRRIGTPLLTGLHLESADIAIEPGEIVPSRVPDLFCGSPLLILGRYRGRSESAVTIHATDGQGRAWAEAVAATERQNPAIAAAWRGARFVSSRIAMPPATASRTGLERAIVDLSLKFHVLSRFTAYVAVDRSYAVNRGGALHQVVQPVEMPHGWEGPVAMRRFRLMSFEAFESVAEFHSME